MLARPCVWLYLNKVTRGAAAIGCPRRPRSFRWSPMALPVSTPHELPGMRRAAPAIVMGAAALGAVLLIGAVTLWFHYGTAVFFEMIASGISACF
jgi:hypothetical protein